MILLWPENVRIYYKDVYDYEPGLLQWYCSYTYHHGTTKYHEFIDMYCYECAAQIAMLEAMNE